MGLVYVDSGLNPSSHLDCSRLVRYHIYSDDEDAVRNLAFSITKLQYAMTL